MSTFARFPDPHVGPFRLRAVAEQDRHLLAQFIASDPFHAGRVTPDFFLRLHNGEGAWAVEDSCERVVFYLKTENAVRLHIQFGPSGTLGDRERNRDALTEGVEWLSRQLAGNGFREMVFDSQNPALVLSAKKRLGFVEASDDLRRPVTLHAQVGERDPRSQSDKGLSEGRAS